MSEAQNPEPKSSLLSIVVSLWFVGSVGGILSLAVGTVVLSELGLSGVPALLVWGLMTIPCLWLANKLRTFLRSLENQNQEQAKKAPPRTYSEMSGSEKSLFEVWFSILKGVRLISWLLAAYFVSDWILTDNIEEIAFSAWKLSYIGEIVMCLGVWWFAFLVVSHRYEINEKDRWGATQLDLYEGLLLLSLGGLAIVGANLI